MDKQLLNALDNLAVAIEMLSNSLDKKSGEANSSTGVALQSGSFEEQLKEINKGIQELKDSNKKILDDTQTIIKLQKEKKDGSMSVFEGSGKEGNKKALKDGVSVILLIAGAVLAIGLAFKLIGTVDWKSVLAISIALPLIAFAFEKMAKIKDLTPEKVFLIGLSIVGLSVAITMSSAILSLVVPISITQALTVVFIAAAFGAAAFGLVSLIKAFKDIKPDKAISASFILPIVLLAMSVAIVGSSLVLQAVKPIGLFQAFTAILIAAAFGVMAKGIGSLISGFKDVDEDTALAASFVIPIVMVALSLAIVGASWYLSGVKPIGLFQALTAILISAVFVVLAYAVKPLMKGIEGVDVKRIFLGTFAILALSAAVLGASYLLSMMPVVSFGQILTFVLTSISVAVSVVVMALAVRAVGLIGTKSQYVQGSVSILILATTIALSSQILSMGDYSKYPSIDWSIGVGLSLGFFGLGAVLLGTQVMNPFFYAGLGVILLVAGTIVAASYIFEMGSYKVYPPSDWVLPTISILGGFAAISVLLGIISPMILLGSVSALMIVGTIYMIDKVFSQGSFKTYPNESWVSPTMNVMSVFSSLSISLALVSPLILLGSLSLLATAKTILGLDKILGGGDYKKYPNKDWVEGTISAISAFQKLMSEQSLLGTIVEGITGLFGLSSRDYLMNIAGMILSIDSIFSLGDFKKYPSVDWVDGVNLSISRFKYMMSDSSDVSIDSVNSSINVARSIGLVSLALSAGDYTKYPKPEWIDGTIYALSKFKTILNMLSFDDLQGGGLFNKVSNLFGGSSPLEQAVSNITLLAIAFEKLGSSMNSFANSIQGLDLEKLSTIRQMTSNVILLSLMDADMLDSVLDKMEERSGVFGELIKNFDVSKSDSSVSRPVKATISTSPNQKSDVQILGEKFDNMTAILADISTVVGSRGTLKTYLNSIKEKQLTGTTNAPSSVSRSDRRLKNIIRKVGESQFGINIYLFAYSFNPRIVYQGIIAQELIGTPFEGALVIDKCGFYSVDYSKIDVEFKKIGQLY